MSEDKKPEQISIVANKWIPQYIWQEMPGIDGQKRRAFYLKQKNLVPLSFLNVLLSFFIKFFINFVIFCIIKWFFMDVVMQHIIGIVALAIFGFIGYTIYIRTIVKNAEDLKEEMVLSGFLNFSSIILGFLTVFVLTD